MVANTAMARAPPASRAVTAAVGLQPASISDLASGPDMPNAKRRADGEQQAEPEVVDGARVHRRSHLAPPGM